MAESCQLRVLDIPGLLVYELSLRLTINQNTDYFRIRWTIWTNHETNLDLAI